MRDLVTTPQPQSRARRGPLPFAYPICDTLQIKSFQDHLSIEKDAVDVDYPAPLWGATQHRGEKIKSCVLSYINSSVL